jgi:ribosomal protein S6
MNSQYEIMLLTRTDLEDAARVTIVERAKEAVTGHGGSWGDVNEWGRRTTSYPIQKLSDAWYQVITFEGTGETVDEAVRVLRITEGVLRVMATSRVAEYPKEAELEVVSDEEMAAGPKDRGRGGRGGRGGGGRGRDRD